MNQVSPHVLNHCLQRPVAAFLWVVAFCAFTGEGTAATYYVDPNGHDVRGDGSTAKPWASLGHALGRIGSSDTLVVRDGVYRGLANFINSRSAKIPSGRPGAPTIIRAEHPFKVRLQNDKPANYYDNPLRLDEPMHDIVVDGFIFDLIDSVHPSYVVEINGQRISLLRSIVRRQGAVDEYGGWIALGGNDNLVEDCAGVGAARYGFYTGGPEAKNQRNIFRRCVGRLDFSPSRQPKATFAVYGNNAGKNVRDVLLQNCIAIDGRRGPQSGEDTYGGFYFPKNATAVTVQGSIALNLEVGYAGFFVRELGGGDITLENSIAWKIYGGEATAGVRINGQTDERVSIRNLTVGNTRFGYYNRDKSRQKSLTNSLFLDVEKRASDGDLGWTTDHSNLFLARKPGSFFTKAIDPAEIRHLPNPVLPPAVAPAGSQPGAQVLYRYGKSATRWGEAGFDQLTDEPLWPWPYEEEIRAVFAEPNAPSVGNTPSINETRRGFATDKDRLGKPSSLTRYIWEFLGTPMPADNADRSKLRP